MLWAKASVFLGMWPVCKSHCHGLFAYKSLLACMLAAFAQSDVLHKTYLLPADQHHWGQVRRHQPGVAGCAVHTCHCLHIDDRSAAQALHR